MSQPPNIPPQWQRYADSAYQQGQAEAQAHYQKIPSPQYAYVETRQKNGNGRPSMVEGLSANVMTVISAIAFVVWATYFGTTQFQSLKTGQERTEEKIEQTAIDIKNVVSSYSAATSDRILRLEEELKTRTLSRWTKTDMEIWCAKTERLNTDIKWRCGPVLPQMTNMPPIWEGVAPSWSTATSELPRAGGTQ